MYCGLKCALRASEDGGEKHSVNSPAFVPRDHQVGNMPQGVSLILYLRNVKEAALRVPLQTATKDAVFHGKATFCEIVPHSSEQTAQRQMERYFCPRFLLLFSLLCFR